MTRTAPPVPEPRTLNRESLTHTLREMFVELFVYRDLLWQMTLRDLRIRYKQAILGFGWALLMPCLIVASGFVVSYVISQVSGQPMKPGRLAAIALKGVPWGFFVGAVGFATVSLTSNLNLVTKIYFPRAVFPLAALLTQIIDSSIGCIAVAILLLVIQGVHWSLNILWIFPLAILIVLVTAGACLFLSCANLFFRDVRYLVQVMLTFGVFFTPIFFDAENLGPVGGQLIMLNPLAPLLEALRLAVVDGHNVLLPWTVTTLAGDTFVAWRPLDLLYSAAWAVPGTLAAWLMFHKLEFIYAEYV